jgi:hypothetical protein
MGLAVALCFCLTLSISSSKIENDQTPEKHNHGNKEQEGEEQIVELDLLLPCSLLLVLFVCLFPSSVWLCFIVCGAHCWFFFLN